jgi:hypothetical protein
MSPNSTSCITSAGASLISAGRLEERKSWYGLVLAETAAGDAGGVRSPEYFSTVGVIAMDDETKVLVRR